MNLIYNNPSLSLGYLDENTKLNKLLYFSELMYYCVKGKQLIDEPFVAFPNGPVIQSVYRDYRYNGLDKLPQNDDLVKSDETQRQIVRIINFVYSEKDTSDLVAESHEHNLWKDVRDYIPNNPIIDFSSADEKLSRYYINLYDLYKNIDFLDLGKEKLNGNIFYYSKRNLSMTDDVISELLNMPSSPEPIFVEKIDGELVFLN